MKKTLLLALAFAGTSVFAEMGVVPLDRLFPRGKKNGSVLVAKNAKLTDITRVAGYMAGTEMGVNAPVAPVYAEGYFPVYRNDSNNTGLGFELQAWSEPLQKTVSANIIFYEQDKDLYVYLFQFKIRANAVGKVSLYSAGSYYEPSTSLDGAKPCLSGLRVWLAGRDRVTDCGYWSTTPKTLWEGVTPTDLTDFMGVFTGGYTLYPGRLLGYNVTDADGVRSVQLQTWGTNDMTRAVHVSVAAADGGVQATLVQARRDNAGDGFKVGYNSIYLRNAQNSTNVDNGDGVTARGVEARIEKRVFTAKHAGYLQTSDSRTVVWEDVDIADILSINGDMEGGWMNAAGTDRRPYYLKFEDGKVSAQFQSISENRLFCVKAVFVQAGADVEGYVEYAKYVDLPADGVALGFDFDSGDGRIGSNKIQTSDSGTGYGGYGLKNVSAMLVPSDVTDAFIWKGFGADGSLSRADNWVGDVAPTSGAKLYFRDPTPGAIVNDYQANTYFEGFYFAGSGSNTVEFTGNAVKVATVDNLSETASVHMSAPVVCEADFEPWVGGGVSIDALEVAGTLAPRGNRPLGPLGTVQAGMLSGGNIHAWEAGVYGFGGAFVRRTLNGSVAASFGYLDTAGLTRDVFEIAGTNTVANRLELPQGQIFAVKEGLTSVPDLGPSGDDPHINLSAGGQLHIREYRNLYGRPVRFEGEGRVSFGATGYADGQSDIFDGAAFGTAGNDYSVSGAAVPGADGKLRFAAVDPDGTFRAITLVSALPEVTTVEVMDGALKAGEVINGRNVVVSGGVFEPVIASAAPATIEFSGDGGLSSTGGSCVELQASTFTGMPKTYRFTAGSSISLSGGTIDLTGATVIFDAECGVRSDVLFADSITGSPAKVISARTGEQILHYLGEKSGRSVLSVLEGRRGMTVVIK